MKIKERIKTDVVVLAIKGSAMSGPDVEPFRKHINRLVLEGFKNIVVDFSQAKWIGSSMLGALVFCMRDLREKGGDLRLAQTERIDSILMVTQLAKICQIYATVERAVASFQIDPPAIDDL